MTSVFLIILGLVILAMLIQIHLKIPSPLTMMGTVLIVKLCGGEIYYLKNTEFDTLVFIILPLLIMIDTLKLDPDEVRHNIGTLFLIACATVIFSVALGSVISLYVLAPYGIPFAAIMALFCMLTATDPVTVSAVFSNIKIPHKLRFLTEGESLFNDATALIIFSIALSLLKNPQEVTVGFIAWQSVKVAIGASFIGLILGSLGCLILRATDDVLLEGAALVFLGYLSYWLAEKYHMSGIIALILCMLVISKRIKVEAEIDKIQQQRALICASRNPYQIRKIFSHQLPNHQNMQIVFQMFGFVATVATGVLFVSMAQMASLSDLKENWRVIVIVFIASSVIRGFVMLIFAIFSNRVKTLQSVSWRWWSILTFAGSKGALAIVMVNFIPNSFAYKNLLEIIVVGNVLLSTFLYAAALIAIFYFFKSDFEKDIQQEH